MPKFSLIVPTYNRAHLIIKTLESVINQDFEDYEVIVINDGSTDETEEILRKWEFWERIRYFKIPNGERAKARNYGILQAKGDFITFLDSDDVLYPKHFLEAQELISLHPKGKFFSLAYELKSPLGKVLSRWNKRTGNLNKELQNGNLLSCMGIFIEKTFLQAHLFCENRELSATEDYELWLRLGSREPIFYNNTITSAIINHEERSVLQVEPTQLVRRIEILMKNIREDEICMAFYQKKGLQKIEAHSWLYVALHLAMATYKKQAFSYLIRATRLDISVLFTRKFLAILKKLVL